MPLSLKGAALAVAAFLLLLLLRRQVSPAWRHALWLLVLLRFVVPDLGESRFSMETIRPVETTVAERHEPLVEAPVEAVMEGMPASEVVDDVVQVPATQPSPLWTSWQWAALVWMTGVLGMLAGMLSLHVRLLWRLRHAHEADTRVGEIFARTCAEAGMRRRPRLWITEAVHAPAVTGLFRPAVLLPGDLVKESGEDELRLVFLHELAHLRRGDLWFHLAGFLILALHWFNPFAWLACRRLRAESEQAADALAFRHADEAERHQFGGLLLLLTQRVAAGWIFWMAGGMVIGLFEGKAGLRHRIENLAEIARGRRWRWMAGLGLFFMFGITGLTRSPAQEKAAEGPKPGTVQISGIVVDEQGKPIAGAKCSLHDAELIEPAKLAERPRFDDVLTNAEGRFVFENVPSPHLFRLSASHDDYAWRWSLLQEKFNSELVQQHRLELSRADSWLSGKVTRKDNGLPVKDAKVYVLSEFSPSMERMNWSFLVRMAKRFAITDAGGRFRVSNWGNAKGVRVLVDAPGMAYGSESVAWKEPDAKVEIVLEPQVGIQGSVHDSQGRAVSGARMFLSNRFMMLSTSRITESSVTNAWAGDPLTDAAGRFHGKALLDKGFDEWITATHPELGVSQSVRFSEWKNGTQLRLTPWNSMHGRVLDKQGQPVREAKLKLMETNYQWESGGGIAFTIMNVIETQTDSQGRYEIRNCLPNTGECGIWVNGELFGRRNILLGEGERREFDFRQTSRKKAEPGPQARQVTGRIVLPEGLKMKSMEYRLQVTISRADGMQSGGGDFWSDTARVDFTSTPLNPGDYLLSITAYPATSKLLPARDAGISMLFRLDPDEKKARHLLGEFSLTEKDFVFRQAGAAVDPPAVIEPVPMRLTVADASSYTAWTAGGGGWTLPEAPMPKDGQVSGEVRVGSSRLFILRATKVDGTRHFSPALTGQETEPVRLVPGVELQGRIKNLPADYDGSGWISAAPRLSNLQVGEIVRGGIRRAYWHTWAPVAKDGSFRFISLPRSKVELFAFGDGWTSCGASAASAAFHTVLTGEKPVEQVEIDMMPSLEKQVQVLLPDGKPAVEASLRIVTSSSGTVDRALGHWSHSHEPSDADAYVHRYLKKAFPGHHAVTDAEGRATLRNLTGIQMNCEITWMDVASGKKHVSSHKLDLSRGGLQVLRLAGEP